MHSTITLEDDDRFRGIAIDFTAGRAALAPPSSAPYADASIAEAGTMMPFDEFAVPGAEVLGGS